MSDQNSKHHANKAMPRHIAIIMDGNGRWAKKRFLPRFIGHKKGLNAVKKLVVHASKLGVDAVTLYAFSTENWRRPEDEVSKLMGLFLQALKKEVSKLHENNVQLRIIGERSAFSQDIQEQIKKAENLTQDNSGLVLNIAANYGGRADILQAIRAWQNANPQKSITALNEQDLSTFLSLADLAPPDLLIRTGGEQRISNFMIWQLAYTELYFTSTLWPDFDEQALELAIQSFSQRERRFGQTSEQVSL